MATVSELCEALAYAANMPLDDVKKYARALINSGDLPKALGRSVPSTDMHHRAKLILALAASERPADCVKAMRERYEAVARFRDTDATAGEVLAAELRELASKAPEAFQKWEYSDLEVSRGGVPRIKFRINENLKHFDGYQNTPQPEFLGGPYLAKTADEMAERIKENERRGLPVSAFVPGRVLIVAAFGSSDAALEAQIEVARTLNQVETETTHENE